MDETELLIEQATTAWRPRDPDGRIREHPAWRDLDAPARERLFDETREVRALERAVDPGGLSTTALAVLARIER